MTLNCEKPKVMNIFARINRRLFRYEHKCIIELVKLHNQRDRFSSLEIFLEKIRKIETNSLTGQTVKRVSAKKFLELRLRNEKKQWGMETGKVYTAKRTFTVCANRVEL